MQHEHHFHGFGVDPNGNFVYVQTKRPSEAWALVLKDRGGASTLRVDVGRVGWMTTVDNLILTIQSVSEPESWSRRRTVRAYKNPLVSEPRCDPAALVVEGRNR